MGKYINPFTDWGFKKIFGQEANKDLLIAFLNILLDGERVITDVSFLDKEKLGETKENRSLIYDIFCETNTGEHIIVEMQNGFQTYFVDRSIFYVSHSIVDQALKGDWDYHLTAVYGNFIMNFEDKLYLEPKLRTDLVLTDRETGKVVSDKQRYIYLQLPYFNKTEEECENLFECLIYVLKKMELLDRMPFEKKNFLFSKLAKIAEVRKLKPEEQQAYDISLKRYRDTYAVMKSAILEGRNQGLEEGRNQGLEEGRKEGRVEGIAQGMAQGIAQGMAQGMAKGRLEGLLDVAGRLKRNGKSVEEIKEITGLSQEDLERL